MARARAMTNSTGRFLAIVVIEIWMMLRSTDAVTYVVGGSTGWSTPANGASFYSNWENGIMFHVGDVLVFNFIDGQYSVGVVTQSDYNNCNTASPIALYTNSPENYTLNTTGTTYFISTYGLQCSQGQKLAVTTSGYTNSPPGTPAPPPPPFMGRSSGGNLYVSGSFMLASIAAYFLVM